jgi:hypothetical protein
MGALIDSLEQGPHGVVVGVVALVVIAAQVVVSLKAWGRAVPEPRRRRMHVLAGASILALPVSAGIAVHAARGLIVYGLSAATDPSEKATVLSSGISGQINIIPFLVMTIMVAVALWFVGLWRSYGAERGPARRALVLYGLLAVGFDALALGALRWTTALIKAFAGMAGVEPALKPRLLERQLADGRIELEQLARASRWTLAGITVACLVLALILRRDEDAAAEGRWARRRGAVSLAALALAAVLFLAARPMRAENALPWPPAGQGEVLLIADPKAPDLEGPDEIERAPVVQVWADKLALDLQPQDDLDAMKSILQTLRVNYGLLHPEGGFNRVADLLIGEGVSADRLKAVLRAVHDVEYTSPAFVFAREENLDRPTFGRLRRVHVTAARLKLIDEYDAEAAKDPKGGEEGTLVRLADFRDYGALARRIVALRASGAAVALDLGK